METQIEEARKKQESESGIRNYKMKTKYMIQDHQILVWIYSIELLVVISIISFLLQLELCL